MKEDFAKAVKRMVLFELQLQRCIAKRQTVKINQISEKIQNLKKYTLLINVFHLTIHEFIIEKTCKIHEIQT